ncbi:serine hydrolase domain-containing protein [Aspergillus affinis]|uniref:serine hydrolase domain-containing protein n=1 Tax=Aspergillus affinis TaxID=1070780 RepID=UPI0022FF4466|nr:uncharacterized protein KD926_009012 [Aspergillus affinis]KAI9039911.1 hypothetical protein KD926_009012 [Aspergillus affinis]
MDSLDQIVAQFMKPSGPNHPPLQGPITLGAVNKDGTFEYVKSFDCANDKNIEQPSGNPIYHIASCTKLITTIAVLQCVEKGILALDNDISKVLREFQNPKVLVRFDKDGDPVLEDSKGVVTLRHLLTHSSGMAYGFESMHPDLARLQKLRNRKTLEGGTVAESFEPILIRHPGEQWEYSPGIDWAGKMVERVNGDMKLGDYMQYHIFDPLGINDITFVSDRRDIQDRLVQCWERSETEGLKKVRLSKRPYPAKEHFGGGGLFASATDLLKIYGAILRKDDKILGEEMVDLMFKPQLQHTVGLDNLSDSHPSYRNSILNSVPSSTPINFGLGGLLNLQSVVGKRGSHSLTWSGMANCYWWIDPQNGIAGVYLSQLIPSGEPDAIALLSKFEEIVYSSVASK